MHPSPKNLLTSYAPEIDAVTMPAKGWFDLEDWVGPQHPSKRGDVAKLEGILANAGDYSLERTQGPTGYWGLALDDGIRKYQKRNGLKTDGILRPGGPTIEHMRENFGALLDGHEPPTPDDIDAHHEVVSDDNPGTIAWRNPPIDLSQVPDLPEIDQAADASNARLVRAMLKTGDIDGYAPLMRDAIEQGGKRGLAEVADLSAKLDEASPGLGGQFGRAIYDGMTKAQRERSEIKAEGGQPKGTAQVAMMPAEQLMQGGRYEVQGTGGGGGSSVKDIAGANAGRAAGTALGLGIEKILETLGTTSNSNDPGGTNPNFGPGYEEFPVLIRDRLDNEGKPTPPPAPAPVDMPNHTGGSIEQPKASDNIETYPAAPEEKRQQIIDDIGKDLFPNYVEIRYGDREENRATDENAETTNLIIETFMNEVKKSHIPDMIHHKYGGSFLGEKNEYKEERTIPNEVGTFNRPDGTFQLKGAKDNDDSMNFNVQTPRKDGTPIKREQTSFDRLTEMLGEDSMKGFPKRLPNQNLEDHKRETVAFGMRLFNEYYNRLWNLPGPR